MSMKLKVLQDEGQAESPREWDNMGKMVCFHRRYRLGDKHSLSADSFSGWEEIEGHLRTELGAVVVLPLYLYDHGGITMATHPFSCHWDSGRVGFIYATREDVLEAFCAKRLTKRVLERARRLLDAEVLAYDQWLRGDLWGYVIENEAGSVVDSCWGFYGEEDAMAEGKQAMAGLTTANG